jgi:hypothetical protein
MNHADDDRLEFVAAICTSSLLPMVLSAYHTFISQCMWRVFLARSSWVPEYVKNLEPVLSTPLPMCTKSVFSLCNSPRARNTRITTVGINHTPLWRVLPAPTEICTRPVGNWILAIGSCVELNLTFVSFAAKVFIAVLGRDPHGDA